MSAQLDRSVPFVDTVFRMMEGKVEQREAVEMLLQAERKHGITLIKPAVEGFPDTPEEHYETLVQGNFFSFLTQTHLVFSHASLYDEINLVLPGGSAWTATWRAWGATLAEWANQNHWGGKGDWNYMGFYTGYPLDYFADFESWQDAVLQVIEAKCRLAGISP